jgi:hypothetical protein
MRAQMRSTIFAVVAMVFPVLLAAQPAASPRDYERKPTEAQKNDIKYIVTTLADKQAIKLPFYSGALQRAGGRIEDVHPLRFLEVIFTDETLKGGVRTIRNKGWVWQEFIGGTKRSLAEESEHNNLTDAQIQDFARNVGIDPSLIMGPIHQKKWDEFVEVLIEKVPRTSEHNRYDM